MIDANPPLVATLAAVAIAPLSAQTLKATRRPAPRGAIPTCRATTPTCTRTARRSSGRRNSTAARSRTSRARSSPIKAATQERTINDFQGPIHAPDNWWQDALNLSRGSQAWLVVDPPDGQIPPLTPEAREAHRRARRGAADAGTRSRRLVGGPQPLRSVPHARPARLDDAGDLRQLVPDRPGAGLRRDPLRDDPRDARHPARRPRARRAGASSSTWATRAATGKATRSSSRRRTSRTAASTATPTPDDAEAHRTLHADRAGQGEVGRDRRRSRPPGRGRGRSPCR